MTCIWSKQKCVIMKKTTQLAVAFLTIFALGLLFAQLTLGEKTLPHTLKIDLLIRLKIRRPIASIGVIAGGYCCT